MTENSQKSTKALLAQMLKDAQDEIKHRSKDKSLTPPKNDEELHEWINDCLGYNIPRYPTDPDHQSPFQFIADAYFERHKMLLAQGPRGGGKTLNYAILAMATMVFKPNIWVVWVAGSENQARDGYQYLSGNVEDDGVKGLIYNDMFSDLVSGDPRVSKTVFTNGARIEIRTGGSEKSVSGPHPQLLIIDELDHIEKKTLNVALEMPKSTDQYDSVTVMASSQYHSSGTLQDLMSKAGKSGIRSFSFDVFDVLSGCGRHYPDECGDCPLYEWVNPYTGHEEELCGGRGEIANGHYSYKDLVAKFSVVDADSFAIQNLLLSGSDQGVVYSQYGEDNQVSLDAVPEDIEDWSAFAGIDMRGRGRIVVLLESPEIVNNKHVRYAVAEWKNDNNTPSKIKAACHKIKRDVMTEFDVPISVFWAEYPAGDLVKDFPQELNVRIIPKDVQNVAYGVGKVRDAFRDNLGNKALYIDTERCPGLHKAINEEFRCKKNRSGEYDRDKFGKDGEDWGDALRYAWVGGPRVPTHLPEHDPSPPERSARERTSAFSKTMQSYSSGSWAPY